MSTPPVPPRFIALDPEAAQLELAQLRLEEQRRAAERACLSAASLDAAITASRQPAPLVLPTRWGRGAAGRLARSGLLLAHWYAAEQGLSSARAAFPHYLDTGIAQDRAPNPFFDPAWYRAEHLDGAAEAPIWHYLRTGAKNALAPGPLFDPAAYCALNPDLAQEPDLLAHFLTRGIREGRRFLRD